MATVVAYLSEGTILQADPLGGTSYADLTDVKEITPGYHSKRPRVDVTPLNATTDDREFKTGLGDPGMLEFKQFWTKSRESLLRTPYAARTPVHWKLILPDNANPTLATNDTFYAEIMELYNEGTGNPDDPIMIVCKAQRTGAVTRTNGS